MSGSGDCRTWAGQRAVARLDFLLAFARGIDLEALRAALADVDELSEDDRMVLVDVVRATQDAHARIPAVARVALADGRTRSRVGFANGALTIATATGATPPALGGGPC